MDFPQFPKISLSQLLKTSPIDFSLQTFTEPIILSTAQVHVIYFLFHFCNKSVKTFIYGSLKLFNRSTKREVRKRTQQLFSYLRFAKIRVLRLPVKPLSDLKCAQNSTLHFKVMVCFTPHLTMFCQFS